MTPDAGFARLRATLFLAVFAVVLPGASCEVVKPSVKAATDVPSAGKFPHGLLGRLLDKVVTDGLVDYAAGWGGGAGPCLGGFPRRDRARVARVAPAPVPDRARPPRLLDQRAQCLRSARRPALQPAGQPEGHRAPLRLGNQV